MTTLNIFKSSFLAALAIFILSLFLELFMFFFWAIRYPKDISEFVLLDFGGHAMSFEIVLWDCVIAPILETLLLFTTLLWVKTRIYVLQALLVSFSFTALHSGLQYASLDFLLSVFFAGLVFSYLFDKFRRLDRYKIASTISVVLCHSFLNLLVLVS